MRDLTHEQRLAVESVGKATSLVAAAGSGKTTVLVERFLGLLASGLKPREILTVTFTNEAAEQLKDRILRRLQQKEISNDELENSVKASPYIGTLHSFCYSILDQYGSVLDLRGIESIASPFDFSLAFGDAYDEWLEGLSKETLAWCLQHYSRYELKEAVGALYQARYQLRETPPTEEPFSKLIEVTRPLLDGVESGFYRLGKYGFDELENLAWKILDSSPELVSKLQKDFRQVCVDEFQDTSRLQWRILEKIVGDEPQKLFVVGDPKQSIYGFRNADVKQFLDVSKEIETMGVGLELTTNFRSAPSLLEDLNQVAMGLFHESDVPFSRMLPGQDSDDKPGRFRVVTYDAEEKTGLPKAERDLLLAEILEKLDQGVKPADIAVLFRNGDRIVDFFSTLTQAGVPATCRQSNRLFDTYDIVDISNYLRAVMNPLDEYRLVAFLRSPFVGLSNERLAQLAQHPGNWFEKCAEEPKAKWFYGVVESGDLSVFGVLSALFRQTQVFPAQKEAFFHLLLPLSETPMTVPQAIAAIDRWQSEDILFQSARTSGGSEGVQLMTVHGAKGLEFPHVFLVDNLRLMPRQSPILRRQPGRGIGIRYREDGEWVNSKTYEEIATEQTKKDVEESKRILYVALTRAKETLTVCLPPREKIPKGTWGEWLQK